MYAFIHIPKTGGSTLRAILRHAYGHRHCDVRAPMHKRASHAWIGPDDLKRVLWIYRNPAGFCGHRITPFSGLEQVLPDLRFFTWLRDPLQRCVSHFLHRYRGQIDQVTPQHLQAFCRDPHQRNVQTRWLCGREDAQAAIEQLNHRVEFIGMTDCYEQSLSQFTLWLDDPAFTPRIHHRNRCHQKTAWPILDDPGCKRLIEEANAADLELIRHVRESILPAQAERYRDRLASVELQPASDHALAESAWSVVMRNWVYKPLLHLRLL